MTDKPRLRRLQIFIGVAVLLALLLAGIFLILVLPFLMSWALKRFLGVEVSGFVFVVLNVVLVIIAERVLRRLSASRETKDAGSESSGRGEAGVNRR